MIHLLLWYAIGLIFGFIAFCGFSYYLIKTYKYRFVENTTNVLEFNLISDREAYYLSEYLDEHDDLIDDIYIYSLKKTTFKNVCFFVCYLIFDTDDLLMNSLNKTN